MATDSYDVVIIGAGNAAHATALAAEEQGASVVILEKASKELRGGNTRFTGGVFRTVYEGIKDVAGIVPEVVEQGLEDVDVGHYAPEQYRNDIMRLPADQGEASSLNSTACDTPRVTMRSTSGRRCGKPASCQSAG